MITLANISVQYGGRFLFNDIGFTITEKDRIGLVGKNGAGKSTLMRLLIGEIKADEGSISMDNRTTLGYLPQDISLNPTKTVYQEAAAAFDHLLALQAEIESITNSLAEREDYESEAYFELLNTLNEKQDRLQHLGGLRMRENVEKILKGLGFVNGDFDRPLAEFSGGWQMRVELAKILLRQPDYILLDEPTNHLDIESIMWLEGFLQNYMGGVLLISHDRAFLDNVSNRTIELVSGKLYDYRTSYSKFIELREQRREKQMIEAKRQEKFIEHTEAQINKFRAKKNKAKFAQTLIKKLERLEKVEVDDVEKGSIKFKFPDPPRSGKVVINIKNLYKSYGKHEVLRKLNFIMERGEKIAFVGKNGEGKSTLTKIICKQTDYQGDCTLGHNVLLNYYEQHQAESLDGSKTVLQTIDDAATGEMRYKVRSLLGAFLFSGEDVDKKVQVLSGGERSRLALAKMLLEPANLIILDEPTNHLDMQSKKVLKEALQAYSGSVIVVSHDREFLGGLTDKVYEFKDKNIKTYYGDIYDFLRERQINSLDDLGMKNRKALSPDSTELESKEARVKRYEQIKELGRVIKRTSNKVSKAEKRIEALEEKIAAAETTMAEADFYNTHPDPNGFMKQYNQYKHDLSQAEEDWETFSLELEELKEKRKNLEDKK